MLIDLHFIHQPLKTDNLAEFLRRNSNFVFEYLINITDCNTLSKVFVTKAAIADGLAEKLKISGQKLLPVKNTRTIGKKDMVKNSYCPKIEVDPETYEVYADGELMTCEPVEVVPLAQKYYFR